MHLETLQASSSGPYAGPVYVSNFRPNTYTSSGMRRIFSPVGKVFQPDDDNHTMPPTSASSPTGFKRLTRISTRAPRSLLRSQWASCVSTLRLFGRRDLQQQQPGKSERRRPAAHGIRTQHPRGELQDITHTRIVRQDTRRIRGRARGLALPLLF